MKKIFLMCFVIGWTANSFAQNVNPEVDDHACFQRSMNKLTLGEIEVPSSIKTRTEFNTWVSAASGGALTYSGACGLPAIEKARLVHDCIQENINEFATGSIVIPVNIDSDMKLREYVKVNMPGVVVEDDFSCEI